MGRYLFKQQKSYYSKGCNVGVRNDRHIDQWNRIKNTDMDPYMWYNDSPRQVRGGKGDISTNNAGITR